MQHGLTPYIKDAFIEGKRCIFDVAKRMKGVHLEHKRAIHRIALHSSHVLYFLAPGTHEEKRCTTPDRQYEQIDTF